MHFISALLVSLCFADSSVLGQTIRKSKQLFLPSYLLPDHDQGEISIPKFDQLYATHSSINRQRHSYFNLLTPMNVFGYCKNDFIENILDRCCDQSKCEENRYETITLCKDVPSALFGAALSSSPRGKIEGFGSTSNALCGAYVMARSPFTRLEITCPVINLSSSIKLQIFDGFTIQPIQPSTETNVIYTTLQSIGFVLVHLTRPDDKFTCEWKAIV